MKSRVPTFAPVVLGLAAMVLMFVLQGPQESLWLGTLMVGAWACVIYARQLRAMELQATHSHMLVLVPYLESSDVREARRVVMAREEHFKTQPFDPEELWTTDELGYAATVCASYNVAGQMGCRGLVDRQLLLALWGDSAQRLHGILRPYISATRGSEGDRYFSGFSWFEREASEHPDLGTCD